MMEDGIRKLNTIAHYKIANGATIKVLKKKTSTRSDVDYSDEHCHLILPDSEANKDMKGSGHKGKQKFKVKEMYLTKLLSTKVAIHSVVENLFRSIWSLPNNKAPVAIKYFFDFLDAQAESKRITDPDVVHIWKTNSLPLRFWVNILKNPQFVFDVKKTSHIDGCLSVIAQAFMDAFSLAEQTMGKEAPTNKLLYAKDIPLYKKEVKAYYKAIRDLPPLTTSEVEEFLTQESKKHENEFNEEVALMEIYRYIVKYYDEVSTHWAQHTDPAGPLSLLGANEVVLLHSPLRVGWLAQGVMHPDVSTASPQGRTLPAEKVANSFWCSVCRVSLNACHSSCACAPFLWGVRRQIRMQHQGS
uniref:Plexin cytoplasmic RasGAP domain-containing protein n=1 Tax=Pavo cristatus TaxID=9049 RepID=A0A8C9FDD3_PAVCR